MKRRRFFSGCTTLAVGATLIAGMLAFLRPSDVHSIEKIKLAVPTVAVMYAPLYFGQKAGFFAAEGFDLEIVSMRTDLAIAALGTGQVPFIAHGGAALRAAAQGFPLKLVFALDDKSPFWLVARPEISEVKMLKGAKIGVSFPGDTPQLVLKRFLRRHGLNPDRDVGYVAGQFSPTAFQGLSSGLLDAAVLAPPFNVLAQEQGLRVLAFLGTAVPDATTSNGIVTSDRKIKLQPEQVRSVVRASLRSLLAYRSRRNAAIDLLISVFEIGRPTAERVYADSLMILTPDGAISKDKIRNILNMIEETGAKAALALKPEAVVDFSFLREAQRELRR
jgi:ABC-type nitrate/sulfonate/bicarbonate transport system substrate-binding protein